MSNMFVIICYTSYSKKYKILKFRFTCGSLIRNHSIYGSMICISKVLESDIPKIIYEYYLKLYRIARSSRSYAILLKIKYTNNDIYVKLINSKDGYFDQLINELKFYHDYKLEYVKVENEELKEMKAKWLN